MALFEQTMTYWDYCLLAQNLHQNALRYVQGLSTTLSDEDYDRLYQKLLEIEKQYPQWIVPYSPSQRVEQQPVAIEKGEHQFFMGSLENIFEPQAYEEWMLFLKKQLQKEVSDIEIVAEPKIDGVALSLVYEKGALVDALTRGDGYIGERVFEQVKYIPSILLALPDQNFSGTIRGEVFFRFEDFDKMNQDLSAQNQPLFSNPRNAAAGTLRQTQLQKIAQRPLTFLPYAVLTEEEYFQTHLEALTWCTQQGFYGSPYRVLIKDVDSVWALYQDLIAKRKTLEFGIDGIVFKVNSYAAQKELGRTMRTPRWAIAWKTPADAVETILQDIHWQVGRLGQLTPVAVLEPVMIDGVCVSSATLHNRSEIQRKKLFLHAKVLVRRAGEVIPEVLGLAPSSLSTAQEQSLELPQYCPSCQSPLVYQQDQIFCWQDYDCPQQRLQRLSYAFSQEALDVPRLSMQTLKKGLDAGYWSYPSDVFFVSQEQWMSLEGLGQKSSDYLQEGLKAALITTPARFLLSLNIRHIGKGTAQAIFQHLSWDDFLVATEQDFLNIPHIGPVIASSLHSFKTTPLFLREYQRFESLGLQWQKQESGSVSKILEGKIIAVSGSFQEKTRDQWQQWIESHGGVFATQVTKKTHLLLVGQEAGSKKDKAEKWNIPLIDQTDILNFVKAVEHSDRESISCFLQAIPQNPTG